MNLSPAFDPPDELARGVLRLAMEGELKSDPKQRTSTIDRRPLLALSGHPCELNPMSAS